MSNAQKRKEFVEKHRVVPVNKIDNIYKYRR